MSLAEELNHNWDYPTNLANLANATLTSAERAPIYLSFVEEQRFSRLQAQLEEHACFATHIHYYVEQLFWSQVAAHSQRLTKRHTSR